jgi:hypothetical protein
VASFCLILFFCSFSFRSVSQNWQDYRQKSIQAYKQYKSKDYCSAAKTYSSLVRININNTVISYFKKFQIKEDGYIRVLSWARCGNQDSAITALHYLVNKLLYDESSKLIKDSSLKYLQNNFQWKKLVEQSVLNHKNRIAKMDLGLVSSLDSIANDDQKYRIMIQKMQQNSQMNTPEFKEILLKMERTDSANVKKVIAILNKYGWPNSDIIGDRSQTLFLVLQHAPLMVQVKYLPVLKSSVDKGEADAQYLAYLIDRTNLMKNKKQIYGTQLGFDQATGLPFIEPIEDPDRVDILREEVDLPPISEYVKNFNIIWDPSAHKKQIMKSKF